MRSEQELYFSANALLYFLGSFPCVRHLGSLSPLYDVFFFFVLDPLRLLLLVLVDGWGLVGVNSSLDWSGLPYLTQPTWAGFF